ncbi:MAG: cytidylate kinase-like family protein [Clostridia bacterium]|nr:cytidylate kinase-like family protein [Clostridia bacterium]
MNVITVSREFGSGGRELGKRLADTLGFNYYDKEIITAVAKELSMDEAYLERATDSRVLSRIPLHFSRTLTRPSAFSLSNSYLLAQQHKIIKELAAKGDCVIVGRGADAVIKELDPVTLFVYADMPSKIKRCRSRADENEVLSDREWERRIKQVDKSRAENYALFSPAAWGDMHTYHLCVNTSNIEIKSIVPMLASYVKTRLERNSV